MVGSRPGRASGPRPGGARQPPAGRGGGGGARRPADRRQAAVDRVGERARPDARAGRAAERDRRRALSRRARARGRAEVRRALASGSTASSSRPSSSSPTSPPTASCTSSWVGKLRSPHRFVYGDLRAAEELLELEPFDLVFFLGVLYHSAHHLDLLSMLNRVTRLGGSMLLESTVDDRSDAIVRLNWQASTGKAKAVPTVAAMRTELAWTGWRKVRTVHGLPPGVGTGAAALREDRRAGGGDGPRPRGHRPPPRNALSELSLIPQSEFARARETDLALVADMCRLNALTAVKRAGSGHLGSSFSAMDIVVFLLYEQLNVAQLGFDHPDRDVYFSSKGHDVPGLYAVLHSLGVVPTEKLLRLRRSGGLDGHPNVRAPGIEANSGSLGMGISKGRGIAWAKRQLGWGGRVVVMVGDGELQEGQNFEALAGCGSRRPVGPDRCRRPQRASVGQADGGDPRARKSRGEACWVWLVRGVLRRPRLRRAAARVRGARARSRTARRCSSLARSRAVACRSWSIRPLFVRMAAPTAGTRAHPTTRASSALVTSCSTESGPVELEPVPAARGGTACTGARSGAGEWSRHARHGRTRVRRRGLRSRRSSSWPPGIRRSSCSTPTSRPTAACAASRRRTRSASSSAASPSRTWCLSPVGSRATAFYPSSTRSRASSLPARTSRSTTTRARARR